MISGVFFMLWGALLVTITPANADLLSSRAQTAAKITRVKNPVMRVLLGAAAEQNIFMVNGAFVVEDNEQNVLLVGTKLDSAVITYAGGTYTAHIGDQTATSTLPLRVTPKKYSRKVTVTSYENRPSWNTELNDNMFFGSVEVVYSELSDAVLLVNELGIEKYVRGIAEAGNENDADYLQTLLTAARTYALYNITNPTKHDGEPYILDTSANDQVYRGAGFSKRAPNIVAAQRATAGMVIRHNDALIIAPYFSQSDGRTRSWEEVWNGSYAWAATVEDPCCTQASLLGHGVGLSAAGARYFAEEMDWGWKKILKYYYTGVTVTQGYY